MDSPSEQTSYIPPNYSAKWYLGLSRDMKLKVFKEALSKFPYLSRYMKDQNIKASDEGFVKHPLYELMLNVLRGK